MGLKLFLTPDLNSIDEILYRISDNSILSASDMRVSNLTSKLLVSFDDRVSFVELTSNLKGKFFTNYRCEVCFD